MRHLLRIALMATVLMGATIVRAQQPPVMGAVDPEQVRQSVVAQLVQKFDDWLKQPEQYKAMALKESRAFPEGTLYPFVIPACGYANLAVADPTNADLYLTKAATLLDLAIPVVAERLRAPGQDLLRIMHYDEEGTYLTYLALGLSGYQIAGGDERYDALRAHLCRLLAKVIEESRGGAIKSYPNAVWSIDTTAAVLCLQIDDRLSGQAAYAPLIRKHLDWLKGAGSDGALGLPYAQHDLEAAESREPPRGCDLSWRIALLSSVDEDYARAMYERYLDAFWLERPPLTGFAEWPHGEKGYEGVDSGPIINGVGATASAFGVATARAMGDGEREQKLLRQFSLAQTLRYLAVETDRRTGQKTMKGYAPFDPAYVAGIFYGDCVLLYSLTFERWTTPAPRPDAVNR